MIDLCTDTVHCKQLCRRHYKQSRYLARIDIEKANRRANYEANKSTYKARAAAWSSANPERRKEIRLASVARNPMTSERSSLKRRATKKKAYVESFTSEDVIAKYGTDCHLCGDPIDLGAPRRIGYEGWETGLHLDHVIPLSRGGEHSLSNCRPSHGLCNVRKGNR